ncbi:MAG: transposase [Thiomicrorhabdus sp.]|nr:transposase [Thiomicrorhabdus sp.]
MLSETGVDMHRWKTAKHFVSWMGLSPNNKISGGAILSSKTIKTKNRAKQTFKMAAFSLTNAKSGLGAFYRRLRSRLGAPKAMTATAIKLAVIFYNMLKTKTAYRTQTQEEYDQAYSQRSLKSLNRRAKQLGMMVIPIEVT